MKRIGIIGGIGPESTVDYYKLIIGAFHKNQTELGYPERKGDISLFCKLRDITQQCWIFASREAFKQA